MKNAECRRFLSWALPRLGLHAPAFRKVHGQVCKRIRRRMRERRIADFPAYRAVLEAEADEWPVLDGFCRITISRFCRDRSAWLRLRDIVLPRLAAAGRDAGARGLRAWSAGCGGGEEPYSLGILWRRELAPAFPTLHLEIVATDADRAMLGRARAARYGAGSMREVPDAWIADAFEEADGILRLRPEFSGGIRFQRQDLRTAMPDGPFDLVLCRYLAFTYFDAAGRKAAAQGITDRLRPGGVLMLGRHEQPPSGTFGLVPEDGAPGFWRRFDRA